MVVKTACLIKGKSKIDTAGTEIWELMTSISDMQ